MSVTVVRRAHSVGWYVRKAVLDDSNLLARPENLKRSSGGNLHLVLQVGLAWT